MPYRDPASNPRITASDAKVEILKMPADWWKVECNGTEIARGTWATIADCVQEHVDRCMQTTTGAPLSFVIYIRSANAQVPPARTRVAGQARELQVEHELARMADDGNRHGRR